MTEPNTDPAAGGTPAPDTTTTTENTATAAPEQDGGLSLSLPEGDAAPAADPAKPGGDAPAIPEGYFKVPGEGATEAEVAAYRTALGIPETAEGYLEGFEAPEGYQVPAFLMEAALEADIPTAALHKILQKDAEANAKAFADFKAAAEKERADTAAALKKEWGKDAPANITLANRVVQQFAPEGFGEFMKQHGLDQDARFIKFAHALAGAVGESAFVDGDGGKTKGREKDTAEVLYPNETRKG